MEIRKSIVEKLHDGDEITKADVKSLMVFNDHYINKLFEAGQSTVKAKVIEWMHRDGMTEI